jgi:hypothetical protein
MKKISDLKLFEDGWLTKRGQWVFFLGGWILIILPLWLLIEGVIGREVAIFLFCVGLVLALIFAYEGKAKQFGYQAPFTSDPMGWRRAKESYRLEQKSDAR